MRKNRSEHFYGDLSLVTELKLEITLQLNKEKHLLKTELLQFKNTFTFYKVYILHPDKQCYRLLYHMKGTCNLSIILSDLKNIIFIFNSNGRLNKNVWNREGKIGSHQLHLKLIR